MDIWMVRCIDRWMDRRTDGQTTSVKQVWREKDVLLAPPGLPWAQPCLPRPHRTQPGNAPRRKRRQLVEEAAPAPLPQQGVLQVAGQLGRGNFGKRNISSSESRPHSSTLEEMLFLGHPPTLCHHRTLRMSKFGAGQLALLTLATFDGRQNQLDCNASQKYIHLYGVGRKSPHWCLVPAGLHPPGKGCKGVCTGCCRQRRGRVGAVQAGFSRGGIAQA